MCDWAMRSLLIENDNKLILIDTGIGEKQDDKFFSHFYLSDCQNIEKKINELGYSKTDITDVMLTHLHFDHCGGAIEWNNSRSAYQTTFQNATYWSTQTHWKWAIEPNAREKASFLRENILPLEESGQLKFIDRNGFNTKENIFNNIDVIFVDGHTESMMLPIISINGKKIVFMADLIPSIGHIPLPYIMGYDTRPLLTLTEKEKFLLEAFENEYILFFEHDYVNECCTLKSTDRGIRVDQTFPLNELF
jgi:glyoxylase-like metal-dependent hydrolase (beta-lactamase superfamily II)